MGISLHITEIVNTNDFEHLDEGSQIKYIGQDLWAERTITVINSFNKASLQDGYNVVYGKELKIGLIANDENKLADKIKDKSFYLVNASF